MQDTKEPSSTMLYVSNLPFSFENDDLKNVFAGFEVSSAYVATRRNGRSKGFGFVTFTTEDQQAKALESVDGTELAGRPLTVKVAHKDDRRDSRGELLEEFKTETAERPRRRTGGGGGGGGGGGAPAAEKTPSETIVYVSNLPFEFTDEDLTGLFPGLAVESARIARRRNDRSKGFGFVEFATNGDQLEALKVDGHAIDDREISVKVSVAGERAPVDESAPRERKEGGRRGGREGGGREKQVSTEISGTTIYVSNLPFDLTDEGLADLFRAKGHKPSSARIARKRDERSKGFGFVEFATEAAQQKALALDGQSLEDREISVKVAKKGSETREDGAAAADEGKRNKRTRRRGSNAEAVVRTEKKPSDVLCYVSNLSFDMDDSELAKVFEGLAIKSAHVAVRRNGRSKGFGFVEFASHADQQKALAKSGTELGGRTLTVEVANEKQEEDNTN